MSRRIILLFAFIGVFAALGMSWHVHATARLGPEAPNCPEAVYSHFDPRDDAPDDDALKSVWPTPIEIQFRIVSSDTLKTRIFTHADKNVPLVRGVMTEESLFDFLEFMQGDRGCHIMQMPGETFQSGVPFSREYGMHRTAGAEVRFTGFKFKGNATMRKDGRIGLQLDMAHSGPKDYYTHLPEEHDAGDFQVLNANGAFVVERGETCFFGGLKRKTIGTVTTRVPLLGELPWIGWWFIRDHEVELDEELLVLATVRSTK